MSVFLALLLTLTNARPSGRLALPHV